jgi:hypothetical protein
MNIVSETSDISHWQLRDICPLVARRNARSFSEPGGCRPLQILPCNAVESLFPPEVSNRDTTLPTMIRFPQHADRLAGFRHESALCLILPCFGAPVRLWADPRAVTLRAAAAARKIFMRRVRLLGSA